MSVKNTAKKKKTPPIFENRSKTKRLYDTIGNILDTWYNLVSVIPILIVRGALAMKKSLVLMVSLLLLLLCSCGSTESQTPDTTDTPTSVSEPEQSEEPVDEAEEETPSILDNVFKSYEDVLEDYSQRIKDAVPVLIDEYNAEAANNAEGLNGLAELCNEKVSALAEIANEGVSEMAEIYMDFGSGSYEEYEEWAGKLMAVYTEEASKIQDAYMESAT